MVNVAYATVLNRHSLCSYIHRVALTVGSIALHIIQSAEVLN